MIKIFISSPYTHGDTEQNVHRQMEFSNSLMDLGFAPFTPLYYHFQNEIFPRPYEDWLGLCFEWIKSCDGVLRLSGYSPGADREVEYARSIGKLVFYSLDELTEYFYKDVKL